MYTYRHHVFAWKGVRNSGAMKGDRMMPGVRSSSSASHLRTTAPATAPRANGPQARGKRMTHEAKTARSCLVCGMKNDELQPLYVDRVPDAQPVDGHTVHA